MGMTNELSTERAIEALYTVRAYYASLTAGYPKGKDCRGIGDVMCSEIANSCLMAIKALEQKSYKSEARRWKRRYLDLKAKEKEWLQTFNTDSATECFTAVQRLKESVNETDN